jgi:choline dehydrogenase-like flavoprotein
MTAAIQKTPPVCAHRGAVRLDASSTRRRFLGSALALSGLVAARRLLWPAAARGDAPAVQARRLVELESGPVDADVCIIGSGPAGAILASILASRGIRTLLVESGPAGSMRGHSSRLAELDAYVSTGELPYPVASTRYRGAGGTSNLWTGVCPRFHPIDFEPHAYTPASAPWPIRYDDLEPYYLRAEQELQVRGAADQPFAPPRSAPFPRPLRVAHTNLLRLAERTPTTRLAQLPWSDWKGQPIRIEESHLPGFTASPHGTLVYGATATRILSAADGRIAGIRLQAIGEAPRTVRARAYVIACGGIETGRLLLLSRGPAFPEGIGNHADLVGRRFMEHPAAVIGTGKARGLWLPSDEKERGSSEQFISAAKQQGLGGVRIRLMAWSDPIDLRLRAPLASARRFAHAVRSINVEVKAEIEMEPALTNRVGLDDSVHDAFGDPGAHVHMSFTEKDRRTIAYAEATVRRILAEVGAEGVAVATGALRWEHHHMGTCRMGDDPRTSVVDRNLTVHGTDNLYVAGSAPFVTSSVSNPTLTIVALSVRLADHLTERLRA